MGFDIKSLAHTTFPSVLCPRCAAILDFPSDLIERNGQHLCPCCEIPYEKQGEKLNVVALKRSVKAHGCLIDRAETLAHATNLAKIITHHEKMPGSTPLNLLFQLLAVSKNFFHFTTWSITTEMMGLLAMAATRIQVRGLVGQPLNSDKYKTDVLAALQADNLNLMINATDNEPGVHSKLYIFDGLVAISGSTNLTLSAWSNAAEQKETVQIITDIEVVKQMNNKYFAQHFRNDYHGCYAFDSIEELFYSAGVESDNLELR